MSFFDDLFEGNGIMDKIEDAWWNLFEKGHEFADKLEEFGDSIGATKTNNYGDLPEEEDN